MTEEESKSVTVRVSSSEEFVQSRRLKQILDSKERVLDEYYESTRNHNRRGMNANPISEFERNRRIAHAVVEFCIEVEPVLDQAEQKEVFEENTVELDRTTHSIADIIDTGGRIGEMAIEPEQSMFIYRTVSKKLADIGIGITLEEDKQPAEI